MLLTIIQDTKVIVFLSDGGGGLFMKIMENNIMIFLNNRESHFKIVRGSLQEQEVFDIVCVSGGNDISENQK